MAALQSAVAGAVLASGLVAPAFAEGSNGGETSAGGQFMSSYTRVPPAAAMDARRVAAPRRSSTRTPSSLSEAIAMGTISPSEAASLQSVLDAQH